MRLIKCTLVALVVPALLAVAGAYAASNSPSPANRVTVPSSTAIHVTLNTALSSNHSNPGDRFEATVSQAVVVDGMTVIPKGAEATGVVVDSLRSGKMEKRAHLLVALETVTVDGSLYHIRTASNARIERPHRNHNLKMIGSGAGAGAIIGAIAGGGAGALIGAPIGAGAGTVGALFTGRREIRIAPETPMTFELAQPVSIDVKG
ncbi:MAG: hypothetical protein KGL75_02855 [Acidobacteriota bacterium]|nr:hypothetical protein [Acidobacteriota bacterium]